MNNVLLDVTYIGKVAYNVAMRYFKGILKAVSIWGQIINKEEFNEKLDPINILIVLDRAIKDILLVQSSIEFDYHTILKAKINVKITTLEELRGNYLEGVASYVLPIINAYYAYGGEILGEIKKEGYKCSERAINISLERAFIAYGMAINDLLHNYVEMMAENLYNSLFYASTAYIQKEENKVPTSWAAIKTYFEKSNEHYFSVLFRNAYGSIIRLTTKQDALESSADTKLKPIEVLYMLMDDKDIYTAVVYMYELLRALWRAIKKSEIKTIDEVMKIIKQEIQDDYDATIEIWGIDPSPVLRIKKPGIFKNIEL